MNRTKGILAAGSLTGLVLITLLALGMGNVSGQGASNSVAPAQTALVTNAPDAGSQAYTQQLEQALSVMQSREAQYQAQLDRANQTILQLQDQINAGRAAAPAPRGFGEEEEHEQDEEGRSFSFFQGFGDD